MENIMRWYTLRLEDAKFYRLGVMAFVLLIQTNIIVPATLLAISMNSGSTLEFGICAAFSFGLLVLLLGGASARLTVPLFIVSTIVHLFIILNNFL